MTLNTNPNQTFSLRIMLASVTPTKPQVFDTMSTKTSKTSDLTIPPAGTTTVFKNPQSIKILKKHAHSTTATKNKARLAHLNNEFAKKAEQRHHQLGRKKCLERVQRALQGGF